MNVKDLIGRPKFDSGQFLGYILWKQSDGFHLKWSKKGGKEYHFQGKIISETRIAQKLRIGTTDRFSESENRTTEWNTKIDEKMDDNCYLTEVDNFLKAVESKDQSILRSSYQDAVNTCSVAWAGLKSIDTGEAQSPIRF